MIYERFLEGSFGLSGDFDLLSLIVDNVFYGSTDTVLVNIVLALG